MTTDMYMKAPTAEAFEIAAQGMMPSALLAIDVLGTLSQPGTIDDEGNYTPGSPLEGWHVNIRVAEGTHLPEALMAFKIPQPEFPRRIFW